MLRQKKERVFNAGPYKNSIAFLVDSLEISKPYGKLTVFIIDSPKLLEA